MFFVDPSGDDSGPGTAERPFATLERARDAAGPGDTVVLRGGVHRLDRTLRLTGADSGVTYRAHGYGTAEQEEVVISGGRPVTGWREGPGGTLLAGSPGPDVRRLRIGGRTAERASVPIEGGFTRTATGYRFDDPAVAEWGDGVEFVYRGVYPWSEARCPVARIRRDGGAAWVEMARPAFERAARLYRSVGDWDGQGVREHSGADSPTTAENSPAFLTEGTFALAGGVLHYLPMPGERPDGAVAPVLETLLHVQGARDVSFLGIGFADAAWSRPGSPGGFLHYHGNGHYDGGALVRVDVFEGAHVTVPGDQESMPGNVLVEESSRITLEGCRFTRLGAVAVEFRGAGEDNALRGCEIDDVSGGGAVVGGGAVRHRVEANRIRRVGREYRGSPAVLVDEGTRDTVVAQNLVAEAPHAGIVVYGGRGAQVLGNLVHDTMQVLADGGGIYLSGPQGGSYADGALVRGNAVLDTVTPYNFGLYTDYGASWVTVQGNVVRRADAPVALEVSPPLEHVAFIGNFWDADPGPAPGGVLLAENTALEPEAFDADPAAAAIVAAAGPPAGR
ncbi:right-handed parallel beta-helix repeat-containing protein [Nocardiopsis sp. CNT-189]|uniref:right-handed parallel beta-helix repeat-containing protein n=1 Tax=Nocardiopsis oceanisediminis TaxID=2816862 RepID=UPI003B295447